MILTYVESGCVYLDGDGMNNGTDLEASLFELHDGGVVDAGALRKDENGHCAWNGHMLLHAGGDSPTVENLPPIEPNGWHGT